MVARGGRAQTRSVDIRGSHPPLPFFRYPVPRFRKNRVPGQKTMATTSSSPEITGGVEEYPRPSQHDPSSYEEKVDIKDDTESIADGHGDEVETDPFVPFPVDPNAPVEPRDRILTVRAVVVGCILGGLVNASNVYLGTSSLHTYK
jgi:hypothetical protein